MGRYQGIYRSAVVRKQAAMGTFYTIAAALAITVLAHRNPLADPVTEQMKKVMACLLVGFICFIFGVFYDRLTVLPKELYQSRRLIWKLAKNDFKKRYAGSYLGMVWAFVQPVVTVVMYWIVFDRVFDTRSQLVAGGVEVPYVLYLTAGLVPWFYFNEALTNGTTALLEYNYLVKKVVFKISILPKKAPFPQSYLKNHIHHLPPRIPFPPLCVTFPQIMIHIRQ